MRLLKVQPHLSDIELKAKMLDQKFAKDFQSYQIIYLLQTNYGKKAEETAKILGITKSKVLTTVASYNKAGSARQPYKVTGGRREARCIMSLEKEEAFLKSVEKEAISGQIITYRQIKSKLEKEINRTVSDDYIWDMFKRHGWKKKVPRQSHPEADKKAQEEFKKNSSKIWLPNR